MGPHPLPPSPHPGVTPRLSREEGTEKGGVDVSEQLAEVWDRDKVPPLEMRGGLEDLLAAQMLPSSPSLHPVTHYQD